MADDSYLASATVELKNVLRVDVCRNDEVGLNADTGIDGRDDNRIFLSYESLKRFTEGVEDVHIGEVFSLAPGFVFNVASYDQDLIIVERCDSEAESRDQGP